MRLPLLLMLGVTAGLLVPLAPGQDVEQVGKSPVEAKFMSDGRIKMDLCPGAVRLTGRDDHAIRVSYFRRNGGDEHVRVRLRVNGDEGAIRVSDCPNGNFEMDIEVPKSSNLYVRMFAGQMNVDGIAGDKDLEIHAGQLIINLGKPEDYARVDASVLTGDVHAAVFNVDKGGLFRYFDHNGPGKYHMHAHVGAGQIELR